LEAFFIIVVIIAAGGLFLRYQGNQEEQKRREQRQAEEAERKRLLDCEEVVRFFANCYGYLARAVVTRDELASRIDTGVSADELRRFIISRMLSVDGIELGSHSCGLPVILPNEYRDKHLYVVGKSGYGKTNFLRYLILQDLSQGSGVGVLAPELEMLTEEILPFIPDNRVKDVIYFNPKDLEHPVVLNPLHLESGDDIDLHVDETFTILQRVVGDGGPRMDEILRHSLYALTERPESTLMDFELLLDRQDDSLRKAIIKDTQDDQTRRFFEHTYPQLPRDAHFPIINRISRVIRGKYVRNCLCPPKRTTLQLHDIAVRMLNIRRAMDEGKILLFNLSDGILGSVASQLIGQLIVAKFQTATMSRADATKSARRPFYLYLDEFQNFCGSAQQSYEKILSRARKYKLGLILAHQQTRQLSSELYREILGNVSTIVSFQVAQADADRLGPEFINQYDFEIESLPKEELLKLGVGEAYCRIGKNTFPLWVPKVDINPNFGRADEVIEFSRKTYGIPRSSKVADERPKLSQPDVDPLADLDPDEVF
jgi:TraM recognition site of TraD and TraG